MMSNPLRQVLESLCCDSPWDYAVFWKFQQEQNQMLLIWDDGLFDYSRSIDPVPLACTSNTHNGNYGDCPIGVAMAEMFSTYYVVGKGLIGEVAYTENPCWIFVDDFLAGEFNSNLISECPEDLLHQFVVGIKTMLLVPLVPHGVLQLGSLDMVEEDATLVINIKNKFCAHLPFAAFSLPFKSERNLQLQPTESMSTFMENLDESFCATMMKIDENLKALGNIAVKGQQTADPSQIMSIVQHSPQIFQKEKNFDQGNESKISMQSISLIDVAKPFDHQLWEISESETMQDIFGSFCVNEEFQCFSKFSGYIMPNSVNPVHKIMHSYPNDDIMEPSFVVNDNKTRSCEIGSENFKFPSYSELHKALGHVTLNHADQNLSNENAAASSISQKDGIYINDLSAWDSAGQCPSKNKVEHFSEAVATNASIISDDSSSKRSLCATSLKSASITFGSSQVEQRALTEENRVPWRCATSAFGGDGCSATKSSPSISSFGCVLNVLLEEHPQKTGNGTPLPNKVSKLNSANKRRVRTGDNQKLRPRDRQLIQDRIKELRELVPNGAKSSIDGLLDRTIKHMQFLTSVTDQADKIRHHIVKKESSQKDVKSLKVDNNTQNGISWAMEYENEQQTCPIVVKDLEFPGHMLIQMLCNDHSYFLEIADAIQRLELTILKGALERRSGENMWAHFIVKTSERFHRLDIFWPLMQLLQQNRPQISSRI